MSHDVIEQDGDVQHKGGSGGQGRKNRHRPFASVLLVGLLAVPALAFVLRFLVALDPDALGLTIVTVAILVGAVLPLTALGIGYRVTRRTPFVVWHVVVTLWAFALWLCLALGLSWENLHRGGAYPLLDVAVLPVVWWILHIVGSLTLAASWLVYRIDALRSTTGAKGKGDTWAEIFGKGVTARKNTVEFTDTAMEIELDHAGVPIAQLRNKIAEIDEKPGVIPGRTTIVREGKSGGRSKLRVTHTDPYQTWWEWPGLTHAGLTFAAPFSTARYADGEPQWFSFARTPDGTTWREAPEFRSPNGVHKGAQGMTSSGKSGDAAIEQANIFARTNVATVYIDPAKLRQNAGWCLDFVDLAAGTTAKTSLLLRGLRKLGEHRARVLRGRDFDDEVSLREGRPWFYVFGDEFDLVKQGSDFEWLMTKGRSLGFRFSVILPRAVGDKLTPNARAAFGAWKQFGISQSYDSSFVLSEETLNAGARPEQFGVDTPGAHYLDKAPGVPKERYALDARTYKTRQDYSDLRAAVIEARSHFTPMPIPADEQEILGEIMDVCNPMRELDEVRPEPIRVDAQVSTPTDGGIPTPKPNLEETLNLLDLDDEALGTGDDELDALLAVLPKQSLPEGVDPREPLVAPDDTVGETLRVPKGKPRKSREESEAEFVAALTRMAERGVTEFGNKDVMEEMRCFYSPPDTSRKFKALLDGGEHLYRPTPGVIVQRVPGKAGAYVMTRL